MTEPGVFDLFNELVGEQLSAVTFVQDYLQLHFDGPAINVYASLRVTTGAGSWQSGDPSFRDAVCAQIAKVVRSAGGIEGEEIRIGFDDRSEIAISLRESPPGGESYYAHGFSDRGWQVG